tara:strand:- start:7130 stop:7831 length:702 start_codon:yes stop_codon:yes gene_type:complete
MKPFEPGEVKNLFNELSPYYDLLNDLFSFGLHRLWKRKLLSVLKPINGEDWVDLCCGTGDITISIANRVNPEGKVVGIDCAEETLLLAKNKALNKPWLEIEWIKKDIFDENLDFTPFDGAVMAYGLRNLADPLIGLEKMRSFLKPGGRAGVLDFNKLSRDSIGEWFQRNYLKKVVIPISARFELEEHFIYLAESLRKFPAGNIQKELAIKAGFLDAKYLEIAGGQMGILFLKN